MQNPFTLVIFGVTGDLSKRYLLPALEELKARNFLPEEFRLIGASRKDYSTLKERIENAEKEIGGAAERLFHIAVPAHAALETLEFIVKEGLFKGNTGNTKILLEKPFGSDLESAKDLAQILERYFKEEEIYRVDHYLLRNTAQDIVKTRMADSALEDRWNADFVQSIKVLASEKIGIEGRTNFYERTGALRDWVQSHLLELLSLVLMELPKKHEMQHAMRDTPRLRYGALKNLAITCDITKDECVKRGQYQGYLEEVKNPESRVETFVSVNLVSNDQRWRGMPITLAHGKGLEEKYTRVIVAFKDGSSLTFDLAQKERQAVNGYVEVYQHAMSGHHELFVSKNEVLETWRILDTIQKNWAHADTHHAEDLVFYKQGTPLINLL